MTKEQEKEIDERKEELRMELSCSILTTKEREKLDAELDSLPETQSDRDLSDMIDEEHKMRQQQRIHNLKFSTKLYALEVKLPLDFFTPYNIKQIKEKGFIQRKNNLFILSFPLEEDRDVWCSMIRMNHLLTNTKKKNYKIKTTMIENYIREERIRRGAEWFQKKLEGMLGRKF